MGRKVCFHPDLIITVCDTMHNETCPNWLLAGIRVAWDLEPLPNDEASVSEFNKQCDNVYSSLKRRIEALANIGFQTLDSEEIKTAFARSKINVDKCMRNELILLH